jgi:hypothetical protein
MSPFISLALAFTVNPLTEGVHVNTLRSAERCGNNTGKHQQRQGLRRSRGMNTGEQAEERSRTVNTLNGLNSLLNLQGRLRRVERQEHRA